MATHDALHQQSLDDPEGFWSDAMTAIDWYSPPGQVLDDSKPPFTRWFAGGQLNTCYNALDRHVEGGRAEQPALVHDSPVSGTIRVYSYRELRDEVARFAGVLAGLGVQKGDTVVVYMPMVPEAAIAMLACARIGAVHSVVFGGFAPHELAVRIEHCEPKVIVSASCGIEVDRVIPYKPLLDAAIEASAHKPPHCVILQRPMAAAALVTGRDVDWHDAMATAEPVDCVPVEATDPLYVLYTSGTTGRPKGVVRDNGGHAVALRWTLPNVYGVQPGDVYWAASDVGWVVGHSYIVYGPLLTGCTTVLYEGKPVGTPDAGAFWRVVEDHRVNVLFTAPTAFRAIKKADPKGEHLARYDVSSLRHLFLAGERLDPDTYHWASGLLGIPVVDHWWQTETGWPVAANCVGVEALPIKPGSPTKPVPGYDVHVLDAAGARCAPGVEGAVAIGLPLPPGCLTTLYKDDERFVRSYFSQYDGWYLTGDGGHRDADGYLYVMGRIDDVINVAGHRLSTGAMEEVLATHPDVAECAVIGAADELKGQVPMGFVVLKNGVERDAGELEDELVDLVRGQIGPVASFKRALVVPRLPKTRSGKILRGTMRAIADDRPYDVPSTIDDPIILDEIKDALGVLPDDAVLISVSDHVFEVPEMFAGILPAHRAADAPRLVDLDAGAGDAWVFGDAVVPIRRFPLPREEPTADPGTASRIADVPASLRTADARLAAMDRDGVRTHVLFPQILGFAGEQLLNLADATARGAACRAYNDHLANAYHAVAPDRLVPVAVVPLPDAELAAAELRRATAAGARGVSLPCNPAVLGLPSWHEPHWDPVFAAAVDAGVPVFVHIATMRTASGASPAAHGSTPGGPLGAMLTLLNLDVMTAVVELAFSPVLVRHPELRVVVLEGGAAWFPYLCERIDFFWGNRGDRGKGPGTVRDRPPSRLLDRALSLGFIDDPAAIRNRAEIGVSRMMWMSDFPHEDGFWPNSRAHLAAALHDVREPEARAIAGANTAALLHLDVV